MQIARSMAEIRSATAQARQNATSSDAESLALVPTMGALHAGHLELVRAAKATGAKVVTSIFVNPLQFGANEDLSRYPRDEAGDLAKLQAAGCDVAWLPGVDVMYPPGDATLISVGGPSAGFEGAARPGHFTGVATVVAKLFGQTGAGAAFFGAKDWQQVQVIRRMVEDLCLPVAINVVPTMREASGLAMSSRNRFLSDEERVVAPALYATLNDAAIRLRAGDKAADVLAQAEAALRARGFVPDYVSLVEARSLQPIAVLGAENRLLAAARLGSVRLLDNIEV